MLNFIKLNDRVKFSVPVADALSILKDQNDTPYVKGEYLGYFVNRTVRRFLADPDYQTSSFNSAYFNDSKKKTLSNSADSIAAVINRSDPIGSAPELLYPLCAVVWGFLGEAEGFEPSGYGVNAYIIGILERVRGTIVTVNNGSQKDMTMAFRRHLVIHGVLSHLISLTFDKFTVSKNQENNEDLSFIWNNEKKLILPSN